jgi:tetratricopeptide (TPR) repeat protein
MKFKPILEMSLIGCLLIACAALALQTKPVDSKVIGRSPTVSEERLRMRLQFHPHDREAHKALIELLRTKNAFRAMVLEDSTWLSNNRSDTWVLSEIVGYSEVALHDPEYAIAQLRLQLSAVPRQEDPENFDNWSDELAGKLEKRGKSEEALPLLRELVRLNPNEDGFWADYGDCLSAIGRNEDALKAFQRSIELNPSNESVHEGFAEALAKAGDLTRAETEYRAALSVYDAQYKNGAPTDSLHSLVNGLVKIEAANREEHALAETRMKLAHMLLLDRKYDDAFNQAKAAMDADHNEYSAFYLQAEICDAKGDHEQAKRIRSSAATIIEKEAEKDPSWKKHSTDMDARALFLTDSLWNEQSGDPAFPSEILSILEPRIASLSPLERVELASAYFALGRVQSGKQEWEKAIASDPNNDNAVSQSGLGEELLKAGSLEDALAHLRRAYELDPQNTTFRMEYDTARQRLGR